MEKETDGAAVAPGGVGEAGGSEATEGRILAVRIGPKGRAQKAEVRQNSWTPERREQFIETLAETCNVAEASRVAKMGWRSAYKLKQRDPVFARDWDRALCVGYDELEAALLRDALFGGEDEETTLDCEGAVKMRKIRRGRDRGVALRLLTQHRDTADRLRADEARARPSGEAALEQLRLELAAARTVRDG